MPSPIRSNQDSGEVADCRSEQEMHKMILAPDIIPETKEAANSLMAHMKWRQEQPGRASKWSEVEQLKICKE